MRKTLIILFAVVLMFNITVFADEAANNSEKDILAFFSVDTERGSESVTIKLSEISKRINLSFLYNPDTGFLYVDDNNYRIYVKAIGSNIEFNENSIVLCDTEDMDRSLPYRFKTFIYMSRHEEKKDAYYNMLNPREYFEGKENVMVLAEASVEFNGNTAQFILRKLGTSSQNIDTENIGSTLDNNLLLVNRNNRLDQSHTLSGLIYSKPSRGRSAVNLQLQKEAMENLNNMLEAAYSEGLSGFVMTSGFRNFDKQASLYNNKTNILSRNMNRKAAMEAASKVVAIPGSSEHQTGLAVDICSESVSLTNSFAKTNQGKWLENNSWKYGFVVRYQKDKTELTGIVYEPWHVRYVGSVHSEIMKVKNMCLEEYVEHLKENRVMHFSDSNGGNYAIQYIDKSNSDAGGLMLSLPETSVWSISNCTKDSYVLTIKL